MSCSGVASSRGRDIEARTISGDGGTWLGHMAKHVRACERPLGPRVLRSLAVKRNKSLATSYGGDTW